MDLNDIGSKSVDRIYLAQNRDQRRALVNRDMKLQCFLER
jgi:hypothetical protein